MSRGNTWVNDDGLVVGFGTQDTSNEQAGKVHTVGYVHQIEKAIIDATNLGDTDTSAEQGDEMPIPAGSVIQNAYFIVDDAFTSGGSAELDIGLKQKDGTDIDDDGIDAAIALGSLSAGDVVGADGDLVGSSVGSNDAYIKFTYDTAAFTGGSGRLVVEYLV